MDKYPEEFKTYVLKKYVWIVRGLLIFLFVLICWWLFSNFQTETFTRRGRVIREGEFGWYLRALVPFPLLVLVIYHLFGVREKK